MQRIVSTTLLMLFALCAFGQLDPRQAGCTDRDRNNNKPPIAVSYSESDMTSGSLPLVRITTGHQILERGEFKRVEVKITLGDGTLDYSGYGLLRYHGHSSFEKSDKAPFYLKTCDSTGTTTKAKLLGMKKAKKWILLGPFMDRSCLRDKFIMDTFRPYFEWVPELRAVEVIVDDSYRGIYYIEEKIGISSNRLALGEASTEDEDEETGGYIVKVDRGEESYTCADGVSYPNYYTSVHPYRAGRGGSPCYVYVDPDIEDMVDGGVGSMDYVNGQIAAYEDMVLSGEDSLVHLPSFAAYLLVTEFSHNVDGYRLSSYMYKHRDSYDPRWRMTLWDYDRSLGNSTDDLAYDPSTWAYDYNDRHSTSSGQLVPSVWDSLRGMVSFQEELVRSWTEMRRSGVDTLTLFARLDSLHGMLVNSGARQRNDSAYGKWQLFTGRYMGDLWSRGQIKPITSTQASFTSANEELEYIKSYIRRRMVVMDSVWLSPSLATSLGREGRDSATEGGRCIWIDGRLYIRRGEELYTLQGVRACGVAK